MAATLPYVDLSICCMVCRRAVEASTLRKLNQQLSAEPVKNVPDSLWLPPNGGLQMLGDAFAEAGCKVCMLGCSKVVKDTSANQLHWTPAHEVVNDSCHA